MNVGMPLLDADEQGLLVWHFRRTEILLRTSTDADLETGGSVWHAAHRLAEYLVKNPYLVRNKRVLELGCGCGLVGLVAAAVGAKSVTLSDIDSQVPIIEENIELNKYARTVKNKTPGDLFNLCEVKCVSIWFGESIAEEFEHQYDVILGADIGYDISLHVPLARTISSGLIHKRMLAILAEEVRWSDIYEWYLEALADGRLHIHDTDEDQKEDQIRSDPDSSTKSPPPPYNGSSSSPSLRALGFSSTIYNSDRDLMYSFDENDRMPSANSLPGATAAALSGALGGSQRQLLNSSTTDEADNIKGNREEKEGGNETVARPDAAPAAITAPTVPTAPAAPFSAVVASVAGMTKYPCPLLTSSEEDNFVEENKRRLRELIRGIYAKIPNKEVDDSAITVDMRQSKCPIKILKVTKKQFQ